MNSGSGDDRAWRAYEPPESPEPEPRGEDPTDPTGAVPTPPPLWPVPPVRYVEDPVPARPLPGGRGWNTYSAGKKFRLLAGTLAVGTLGMLSIPNVFDDSLHTQEAVEVHTQAEMLDVRSLERLERLLRRQLGSTTVSHLTVAEDAITVLVAGDGPGMTSYVWRGGRLRPGSLEGDPGLAFDLDGIDLRAIGQAGREARRLARPATTWIVTVAVPAGESAPVITASATGPEGLVRVELDADGELIRRQTPD
ncbi:hypothetical protein HNR19_000684 [Nocardioides thalensis]|uniref:Uncharacterized protein n=1 Tax=Nocardioides thalensis TaxID=1914755 RepID=A0A853BZ01_9ACTN|nr:hypothetical protein [Nocardioides thalensis]NYI99985.1 hypothetical protein [Nocardioides thalensis]